MTTIFFEEGKDQTNSDVAVKTSESGDTLKIFSRCLATGTWVHLGEVPLDQYRLFRPDHDSQYLSPGGRLWSSN